MSLKIYGLPKPYFLSPSNLYSLGWATKTNFFVFFFSSVLNKKFWSVQSIQMCWSHRANSGYK